MANFPHLILDMCFAAADTVFLIDSKITALKCVHCQNLHVDTILTLITSKHICKCSECGKNWYESQVVSGNPFALLGVKMRQ